MEEIYVIVNGKDMICFEGTLYECFKELDKKSEVYSRDKNIIVAPKNKEGKYRSEIISVSGKKDRHI